MAASAGAWYRVGKVNVTNGNQSVVGFGTNWQSDVIAIAIGDAFTLDAKTWYEVVAVNSDTSITLDRGFEGSTGTNKTYAIVRNTSGTILTRIAGQVSVQFNQKQLFLDELRTWLNSDNETEELTDSHGLKQSLKTPSQMVRDHDNKLAELDAINPYPWAMRKVEFEARRAANNEKFAASGFVHFGKHRADGSNYIPINEGLYTHLGITNTLQTGASSNQMGESKTDFPMINIAGVLSVIYSLGDANYPRIKFPPAEDGTRTYDSATGSSVTHATPAIAFASETDTNKVVTDRVDMWGFEAFLREINDADPFVYKNGLIQSQATIINGVTTVTDNIRPATYFAWYEGDTTSIGKGVNWQTATEVQRQAIASDPENNIYFYDETGMFYQWCIRGRSFAGAGNGDWASIDCSVRTTVLKNTNGKRVALPQGILSTPLMDSSDYYVSSDWVEYNPFQQIGVFTSRRTQVSSSGECYFLVCGTVSRLNQGAYHPSFNPLGAGLFVRPGQESFGGLRWDSYQNLLSSKSDCFIKEYDGGHLSNKPFGNISNVSTGRIDGKFYDAIYASGQGGVCRDMRYSAQGLTQEDFAEADLKVKAGEYRGREKLSKVRFSPNTVTVSGVSTYSSTNAGGSISFLTSDSDSQRSVSSKELEGHNSEYWILVGDNGESLICKRVSKAQDYTFWPYETNTAILYGSGNIASEFNSKFPSGTKLWVGSLALEDYQSMSGEYTHTEVIGDPANILQCDGLKDGWVGNWVYGVPNGSAPRLNKKSVESSLSYQQTSDFGVSWTTGTRAIDKATNEASIEPSPGTITLLHYKVLAGLSLPASNSVVKDGYIGIGTVCFSDTSDERAGSNLGFSLTGNIMTSTTSANKAVEVPLLKTTISPSTGLLDANNLSAHQPCPLLAPTNNSTAFKALNYATEESGQGFINYAYTELKHDGTDWGDDGKIHIADNQTTMLDTNGNTVKLGTARIVEPLGWVKNDK